MQFEKFSILRNPQISNSKSSKNVQFGKFQKYPKSYNFENHQILEIVQFPKIAHFQNLTIWQTQNSIKSQFNKSSYISNVRTIQTEINSKIKKTNNSSVVLLIFEISKFLNFVLYIWLFQILIPTIKFYFLLLWLWSIIRFDNIERYSMGLCDVERVSNELYYRETR